MKNTYSKYILISVLFFALSGMQLNMYAQEPEKKDYSEMTKEEIMEMSYDELLNLPFEDLLTLADIVGVSAEELLEMILNQEVSTASKKAESVFDSPLSTSVITSEEIMSSGANSIPELFRLVPGMIVREKSNGNYDVHIRGNDNVPPGNFSHFAENTMTLVMIDNRIVYNYINGGTFWETLPVSMTDIERIDIIRGPSSALYGPNAVSGVINIITKHPESKDINALVDARHGNFNTKMANATISGGFSSKLKFRVSGNYEYRDRFQEDYYSYIAGVYQDKDDILSLFGYPYASGGRTTLPTPDLAKDRYGANLSLFYDHNEDVSFNLTGGLQESEIQTIFFENLATPFANRYSKTNYLDFSTDIHGFSAQVSYMGGLQDLSMGMNKPVIKYDMNTLNTNLEYNFRVGDVLGIRPGFSYQKATYDDTEWVKKAQEDDPTREGLLNGKQSLGLMSASLRADYTPINSLRFIAAMRIDKYEKPDDYYFSYQFVGSYKLSEEHLFRAVYSRANRSAFIGNVYADFQNPLGSQDGGMTTVTIPGIGEVPAAVVIDNYYQYYVGNENLQLLTMDMFEFGHRWKISDNLQTDIEVFYTKTKDFDALVQASTFEEFQSLDPTTTPYPTLHINYHDSLQYQNIDIQSKQVGASFSINYMPVKNMLVKAFGTFQKTDLIDYNQGDTLLVDRENDWTPSFFGGLSINYKPTERWNFYANAYYFSEQVYERYQSPFGEENTDTIEPKVLLNLSASFKVWKEHEVFVNARNITNNSSREFGFADDINGLYMAGIRLSF